VWVPCCHHTRNICCSCHRITHTAIAKFNRLFECWRRFCLLFAFEHTHIGVSGCRAWHNCTSGQYISRIYGARFCPVDGETFWTVIAYLRRRRHHDGYHTTRHHPLFGHRLCGCSTVSRNDHRFFRAFMGEFFRRVRMKMTMWNNPFVIKFKKINE